VQREETVGTLVAALREYGVRYLSGADDSGGASGIGAADLFRYLACSDEPHLRHAITSVLLVHPELASVAQRCADTLPGPARDVLIEAYVAAVYLRTLWRTRLRRYLGEQPELPPLWVDELRLPDPREHFGQLGLAVLDARRRQSDRLRPGHTPYERVARNLFGQLVGESAAGPRAAA
jgi:hypothetical protein